MTPRRFPAWPLALLLTFGSAAHVQAQQTFVVDRLTDAGEGEGVVGDLRYCIAQATSGDRILFAVEGTINLTSELPTLNASVTIEGPGAGNLTVRRDSGGNYRIFTVGSDASVLISGLTIANGVVVGFQDGGGIHNSGTLTVNNAVVSANVTLGNSRGGGIHNTGILSVSHTTVSGNYANGGGGVANLGSATISSSTISANSAEVGGGIFNLGTLTIGNSTIVANFGVFTGGIYNEGTSTLSHSTIAGNRCIVQLCGGGLYNESGGTLFTRNTIVAKNLNYYFEPNEDVVGTIASQGHNLIGFSAWGSGYHETDLLDVNPRLGLLQDNGGPTRTMALLPDSPAIDAGDNTDAPEFDQRGEGFPRVVNDRVDIGAYEVQLAAPQPRFRP